MQPLNYGKTLLKILALLSISACRNSTPPQIEVCILDGFGAGDCIEADGSQLRRLPSEMKNYWSTSQPDMNNFSAWCYDTSPSTTAQGMEKIRENIHANIK